MGSLRADVGSRLPHRWTNRLRAIVRGVDQLVGLPLAPWRPGAVCLYHVGRCGSSVIGEMLNRHPAVRWDREVFFHLSTAAAGGRVPGDPRPFLRRRMWCSGRRWYGCEVKILPQQDPRTIGLPLEALVRRIADAGVTHHVVLRRRNALRRMISAAAGTSTGQRHLAADAPPAVRTRVRLDVAGHRLARRAEPLDLVACIDTIQEAYADLDRALASRSALSLTFEDDVAAIGPQRACERVCAFLGIPAVAAQPHTRRLHDRPVEELLENRAEVISALRGTPHEWMLAD